MAIDFVRKPTFAQKTTSRAIDYHKGGRLKPEPESQETPKVEIPKESEAPKTRVNRAKFKKGE